MLQPLLTGQQAKEARTALGLSQGAVATAAGINRSYLLASCGPSPVTFRPLWHVVLPFGRLRVPAPVRQCCRYRAGRRW